MSETSVTLRHTTRTRLKRLPSIVGPDRLDAVLLMCDQEGASRDEFLDALCLNWFGPLWPRHPRSDRGGFHQLPERCWSVTCETCEERFEASRWDARYCSPACRQKSYRQRQHTEVTEP